MGEGGLEEDEAEVGQVVAKAVAKANKDDTGLLDGADFGYALFTQLELDVRGSKGEEELRGSDVKAVGEAGLDEFWDGDGGNGRAHVPLTS